MIHLDFTPKTIEELLHEKRHHPHPRVRQKMEVLYYKSQGMSHEDISNHSKVRGRATLARYFRQYQEGGLDRLRELKFRKPESRLSFYRHEIAAAMAEKPSATINEARHRIAAITGIERSLTAVQRLLKTLKLCIITKRVMSPFNRPSRSTNRNSKDLNNKSLTRAWRS
jgi:transposase